MIANVNIKRRENGYYVWYVEDGKSKERVFLSWESLCDWLKGLVTTMGDFADIGTAPMSYGEIQCETHGYMLLGYVVCKHVIAGAAVAMYKKPSGPAPEGLGSIGCAACRDAKEERADDLELICAPCAEALPSVRRYLAN